MGSRAKHRGPATGRHRSMRPRRSRNRPIALAVGLTALIALGPVGLIGGEGATTPLPASGTSDALGLRVPVGDANDLREKRRRDEQRLIGTVSRGSTRAWSGTTNRVPTWLRSCRTLPPGRDTANGQIAEDDLCELPEGGLLRGDAAGGWARLRVDYARETGQPLCLTGGYRDLASQSRLYAIKPGLAARPGTSNHGWGIAVDLCGGIERFGSVEHQWMVANAPEYGWTHPTWARATGSKPEPWHWEFVGGG